MSFKLSVPANLLLLGEYAVTEEGGIGLALAASPRVRISGVSSGHDGRGQPRLDALMGPASFHWEAASGAPLPALSAACFAETRAFLEARGGLRVPRFDEGPGLDIVIDSSSFFAADGSKLGLGSSAAVAVGLTALLLRSAGLSGEELEGSIFPTALAAHRRAQGGGGSGYDVAASRFGGLGLFTGGASPTWERCDPSGLPGLRLFRGRAPVSSAAAVDRYKTWRRAQPEAHRAFLENSKTNALAFLAAGDLPTRLALIREAEGIGVELGEAIGVPARMGAPPGAGTGDRFPRGDWAIKALGAGDELGLLALAAGGSAGSTTPVQIEGEGLRWE